MKSQNYFFLLAAFLIISCKKQQSAPAPSEKRYTCVCNTEIQYIEHCGTDSQSDTTYINSTKAEEAGEICRQKNASDSTTYIMSKKTCAIM